MPPDRGILHPSSSITNAPQVEIIPAMTQTINAIPTLPLNLNIVAGVEKILIRQLVSSYALNYLECVIFDAPTQLRQSCSL